MDLGVFGCVEFESEVNDVTRFLAQILNPANQISVF